MSPAQSVLESWRGLDMGEGLAQGYIKLAKCLFPCIGAGVVCFPSHPDNIHHASQESLYFEVLYIYQIDKNISKCILG